ncbi:sporulation-induced protein [Friedmanniomyces endolithicus]|uniref:Sporulation-induced protein n=1 Tax=Friedmanniomyces endolithicus TaxID=329885 RepID=A0AAN6J3F7_9PEZI|nr:sporulation-induced protein [Friedmanniomyces endolithicus]KAK0962520.1 sporulation-induced protein [Friedmanniomyces endolithicus]KAK0984306.1 sporulation-induced protein [Friedmanniomyces endolithicus]KAK1042327.1 sporulation-induced protein [Friedmanniomyces endolithicus]
MFWRFGGYANISSLDTILDKPDVTVEELLEESDLIQELKQQNSKLIEFLRDEPVLKKLLKYVVTDDAPEIGKDGGSPSAKEGEVKSPGISFFGKGKSRSRSKSVTKKGEDGETEQEKKEAQRKKYAYVAAEVLSSEVWSITEALLEHRNDLREFWQYMHTPAPLDPLQAGYFTKVNEALLDKKTEDMLAFFRSLEGIVPAMLQHVDCPMVMDLLLKIISLEKHEGGAGIVDWLQTQDIIPLLLGYLTPEHNNATQTSAGDFLKAIITISANATTQDQSVIGPNELTRQLVSEQCIQTLIGEMLRGGNALTVGVGIIIEVIRKNNSDYDVDSQVGPEPKTSDPIYLGTLLRQFARHVPDFMHLIRSPSSKKPDLKAAFGRTIEPLGFDRFKTCELMAELLHCSNMGLLNERGAEEDVRKRDAERERLKAEGKLATPRALISPVNDSSHDEFASSVDSHGFHHAERPTDDEMGEKVGEGRRLEIQNASDEDGYEKVNPRDAEELPDEVNFDEVNEKAEESGLPALEKVDKRDPSDPANQSPLNTDVPKPLSPSKPRSPLKTTMHFDPPPTHAADSPTSSGVTDKVGTFSMDEDTVMTEFGEEPTDSDDEGPSELEKELAKDVDRPAPLFARKEAPAADDSVDPILGSSTAHDGAQEEDNVDQSIATIQGEDAPAVSNGERMQYDTEADGSPVVGDLLKIRFVDYHVVPTILDFFFRFPWNNFLHNVVYDVVQQVFNGTLDRGYNRTVALDLFKQIVGTEAVPMEGLGLNSTKPITNRILDGQAASDRSQADKGMRLGYMGHLTLIAEEVCKFGNRRPAESLDQSVHDGVSQPEWIRYVGGTLSETHDKDNAVLGGVRPENAIGLRNAGGLGGGSGGIGSGFTSNTTSALASAGIGSGVTPEDSLAMSEGTVGQSFEINSGTMLSGFGEGGDEDEDEMAEEEQRQQEREGGRPTGGMARSHSAFSDDEQPDETLSPEPDKSGPAASSSPSTSSPSIPPPLNIPPSRARRQLAARLAQKKRDLAEQEEDPDAADGEAVRFAQELPEEPRGVDLGGGGLVEGGEVAGLQITGLRSLGQRGSASRFSGLFGSEDSSSEDGDEDEEEAGGDVGRGEAGGKAKGGFEGTEAAGAVAAGGVGRRRSQRERRPSTTEAKERKPLDDEDDDEDEDEDEDGAVDLGAHGTGAQHQLHLGEGPFADPVEMSSEDDEEDDDDSEDELVEIRPTRRTS